MNEEKASTFVILHLEIIRAVRLVWKVALSTDWSWGENTERSSLHVRYDLDEGSAYTRHVARIENICVHSWDHNKMEKIVEHNKLKQISQNAIVHKIGVKV